MPQKIADLLEEVSTTSLQPKPNAGAKKQSIAKSAGRRRIREAFSSS